MPDIDLVFFDLDGTLVDTARDITAAVNHALSRFGLPLRSEAEVKTFLGAGVEQLMALALGENAAVPLPAALNLFLKYRWNEGARRSVLYPHVKEVLERLAGVRKAVVSNGRKNLVDLVLKKTGIFGFFDVTWGGDEPACRKPSPLPLRAAMRRFHTPPERAIMVGDMVMDLQAAKAAEILTCAATYGFGKVEDLVRENPDFMISEFRQLPSLLFRHSYHWT